MNLSVHQSVSQSQTEFGIINTVDTVNWPQLSMKKLMVRVLVHRQSGLASRHELEQEVQMLEKSVFSSVTVASLGHQFPQTQHC